MAWSGWSLNATPTFRGLSYDEWAKPLQQATDFHKELETQYGELDAKASMWDKLANDALGKDSKAYKQYKAYADDLRSQADDLAKNGLGYNSRRNLLNMVGRYSSEITPIEEAWKKREALAKEQNELLAKNPDMLTNRYAGKESIDFFMDNPEWSYNTLNMKDRYEKVWKQAGAFKEQLLRNVGQISESNVGNGKSVAENLKWVKSSVPATYERIKAYGNDTKSLAEALNNPNSDLNKMLEAELYSTGMEDWEFAYSYDKDKSTANRRGYEDARNRFMNFMGGATLNTLGKTEFEHLTDNVYLENIKYAHQKALQDKRLAAAAKAKSGSGSKTDKKNFTFTDSGQVVSGVNGDDYKTSIRIRNANALSSLDLGNDKYNTYLKHIGKSGVDDITKRVLERFGEKYKENNIDFSDPEILKVVEDYVKNPTTHILGNNRYLDSGEVKDFMNKYNYESADDIFNRKKENGEYDNETLSKIDEASKALKKANDDLNYFETVSARNNMDYGQVQAERDRLKSEIVKAENNLNNLRNLGFNGNYDYSGMDMFISDAIRKQQNLRSTNTNDKLMFENYTSSLESNPQGRTSVTIIGADGKSKETKEMVNLDLSTKLKNGKGSNDVMHFGGGYDPNSHTFGIWNANKVGDEMWRTPLTKEDLHLTKENYDRIAKKANDLSKVVYGDGENNHQAGKYSEEQKKILVKYELWDGRGNPPTRDEVSMVMNNYIVTEMELATNDQFATWTPDSNQGFDSDSSNNSADNVDLYDYEVE